MSGRVSTLLCAALCVALCGFAWAGFASAAELPDGRGYEQVSPEEKYGTEVYQPVVNTDGYEAEAKRRTESDTGTEFTFQAAADGSGLALVEGPMVGGNESAGYGSGNEYLATRSADGVWSQRLLSPEGAPNSVFEAFTPSLSTAFVSSLEPLSPEAPGYGEVAFGMETYDTLYTVSTNGGEYLPFFSTKPPYRPSKNFGTVYGTANFPGSYAYGCASSDCIELEGASADYTHLLFAANDALTGPSEGRPAAEGGGSNEFALENNLYESVDGQSQLVNVLPNGTTHANAAFGGLEKYSFYLRAVLAHAISTDGSRIFWTDLNTGHIYMREDGVRTVEVSPTGTYQFATPDGSAVFYTNGGLYEHDMDSGSTADLTPGITVSEVLGASESGDYIYYVNSEEKLAVLHDGVSKQITTVPILITPSRQIKSEVTPDGHSIVFMQEEQKIFPHGKGLVTRVEVYNAETGALHCVSCTSSGTLGYLQMSNKENMRLPRWISADGSRVFFVSFEGLVPQDINEEQDVYEWVRPGTAGCTESNGCLYLLTGGTSVGQSSFLDASENGGDVFVVTRANLDGSDEDGAFDAYDVRLGAQRPPVLPLCTGTGCQGIPAAPPIFATPSSVTFEGVGNFATPAHETKSKPQPKKKPKSKSKKKPKGKRGKAKAKKSAHKADARKRSGSKGGRS